MQEQNRSIESSEENSLSGKDGGRVGVSGESLEYIHAKPKGHGGGMFGIAVVGVVLLLGVAGYFFLQQLRDKQEGLGGRIQHEDQQIMELTKQLGTFQSQIATLQSQMTNIETKFANKDIQFERGLTETSEKFAAKLEAEKAEIDEAILRIQRQLGKTRGDWLIADAEYLLSVANERLQLVGDIKTTLIALEAADQRLRESGDPAVFKVRETIAGEINQLRALTPPDIVGTFSKVQALAAKAAGLPVFLPHPGKAHAHEPDVESKPEVDSFDDLVNSAWQDLKGLVVIRRTDRPVDAVLLPEEVEMIRQQLRTEFEIAKLALVQKDNELYRMGLENAAKWLIDHYEASAEMNSVIAELKRLRDEAIVAKLPDISGSLKMLRDINKLRIETDKALQGDAEDQAG
ncbi:MAG: uroporphyrinogen-III C-methyltransferase [Pseudomonadota bacterium]